MTLFYSQLCARSSRATVGMYLDMPPAVWQIKSRKEYTLIGVMAA